MRSGHLRRGIGSDERARWARLVVGVLLAATLVSLPAGVAAAAPSPVNPVTPTATLDLYVGCSTAPSAEPAHTCTLGEQPGAFLESTAEVEYEVCVTFPSANIICSPVQMAMAGVLYVNPITTNQLGEHVVRWFVGGSEVASWAFVVEPAPVPTPPTPPESPVPPAEVEPAITQACAASRDRTRRLQTQLRHATTPTHRRHLRPRLRHARSTAKRVCA